MMNVKLACGNMPLKVLCLGAHSDDIEIGCGGTILKLIREYEAVEFDWVVLSASGKRKEEARNSADAFLTGAKRRAIMIKSFRDGYFPYKGEEIKDFFEELKRKTRPDLIFTHHRLDLHQDHRLVAELTWNTFRDHLILEYEISKYDADLRAPNVFTYLDQRTCRTKTKLIIKHFQSQAENQWFSAENFQGILRLRGMESNSPTRYAEGFYCRKTVLF